MKREHVKTLLQALLFVCLLVPSSFAMDKQELINELNRQIDSFKRSIPECPVISKNPDKCVAQFNSMIESNQKKIAQLRGDGSAGEKATRANCGAIDSKKATSATPDLCLGNLVCMTNLCGGEATCP